MIEYAQTDAARGELRTVGATTSMNTASISRKTQRWATFQPVLVNEPSVEDTNRDPARLKERTIHHGVVSLMEHWWRQRCYRIATSRIALPDKAIDIGR